MKKEDMAAAMTGITTRPKAQTKGAITGFVPKEAKTAKERKVVSIAEDDYRKLKLFAAEQGITITEAFARVVENSTIL